MVDASFKLRWDSRGDSGTVVGRNVGQGRTYIDSSRLVNWLFFDNDFGLRDCVQALSGASFLPCPVSLDLLNNGIVIIWKKSAV